MPKIDDYEVDPEMPDENDPQFREEVFQILKMQGCKPEDTDATTDCAAAPTSTCADLRSAITIAPWASSHLRHALRVRGTKPNSERPKFGTLTGKVTALQQVALSRGFTQGSVRPIAADRMQGERRPSPLPVDRPHCCTPASPPIPVKQGI